MQFLTGAVILKLETPRSLLLAGLFAVLGGGIIQSPAQQYAYSVTTAAGAVGVAGSKDASGTSAHFRNPQGIAIGKNGIIYIADTSNHTIRALANGSVTTLAGLAGTVGPVDGVGNLARFSSPMGLATDAAGVLYVADTGNNTVRKVASDGTVTTLAGSAGWMGAVDGTGATARFFAPKALAVDASGNIYVADTANQLIRKVTPSGVVTTLAGLSGQAGMQDGTGTQAQFSSPAGIAVGSDGNIYVADTGNSSVREVTPAGGGHHLDWSSGRL